MRLNQISLPVIVLKEGEKFIAYSPALDISTSADTFEQAKERFGELIGIFLEETCKSGNLEEVLLECGWQRAGKHKPELIPPRFISQTEEIFKVPCRG